MQVPFFRPELDEAEIEEVVATLRSGWLTTGPRVARFEEEFAEAVGARHAIALNSGTAALHLGSAVLGLEPGDVVLVPTMTFAATAEVVRYAGAIGRLLTTRQPVHMEQALEHQRSFWRIVGIVSVIYIVLAVIGLFFAFVAAAFSAAAT